MTPQALIVSIKDEIARFRIERDKLARAVAPHSKEPPEQVIAYTSEFGVAATVREVSKPHNTTGITVPGDVATGLEPTLRALLQSLEHLDRLVSQREDEAAKNDPTHKRVYMHFDREFTIDLDKGTVTYLDDPSHPQPIQLAVKHTRDQPDPGRFPSFNPEKERGRT